MLVCARGEINVEKFQLCLPTEVLNRFLGISLRKNRILPIFAFWELDQNM